ncbi:TOX high mobility group box family member 3-like isoform X3 [Daktulosphaira vitifoliae]|nr:TOX high mobility group box family member 3-like isoform X3 [Daktulosphaira vitifoliae]
MHNNNNNHYMSMGEHTFHTPSFGDEGFDIPSMANQVNNSNTSSNCNTVSSPSNSSADSIITSHTQPQPALAYQHTQQMMNHHHAQDTSGMQGMNTHNTHHSHQSAYQQPLYLTGHEHGLGLNVSSSYSQPSYTPLNNTNASNGSQNGMMYHRHHQAPNQQQQQQQQHHHQQQHPNMIQPTHLHYTNMGPPATSPLTPSLDMQHRHSNPTPTPEGINTTSDDSDDSTPHQTMLANKRERLSPEPIDGCGGIMKMQQKKPKPTKKKKKRDPNEPQKPVSAYALFFRDTQAAIKGKNPNASFGEVSKIVASMWDSLDADHKNVYKKKTEAAKKDYLKALAAYRASLVSKGGETDSNMYAGGYVGSYGGVYNGYSPPAGLPSPPMSVPSPHSQVHGQVKKSNMMMDNRVPVMNNHTQNHNQSQQTTGLIGNHNQGGPVLNHLSQHPQGGLPPSPQQSQPPTPPTNVSSYWPWCFNPTQNSH